MFQIRNIKISLRVKHQSLDNVIRKLNNHQITPKQYSNFIIFKNIFTYTFFTSGSKSTNHVNITQIPDKVSISHAVDNLKKCINCKVIKCVVDNIIATADLKKTLNLRVILKNNFLPLKKYNNEVFPGLFVKYSVGTAILFHSGKLVIVGCKRKHQIKWIVNQILTHVK